MKLNFNILKKTVIFFVLMIVLIIGLAVYNYVGKKDTFYIANTEFSDFQYLAHLESRLKNEEPVDDQMSVFAHRLSKGKGSVLAYRWYSLGGIGLDDEVFEKLTIWLVELPTSYPIVLDVSKTEYVKVIYTSGASAWPKYNCSSYVNAGSIQLYRSGSILSVKINAHLKPSVLVSFGSNCKEQDLNLEFSASELKFNELTPWLGLQGAHPYSETHRK